MYKGWLVSKLEKIQSDNHIIERCGPNTTCKLERHGTNAECELERCDPSTSVFSKGYSLCVSALHRKVAWMHWTFL